MYHKSRKKSTKTGIGFLGRVYSCDEIGRIVGNWRYTLVMSPTKTAGNRAKKNTPWDYHGMFNIPGGARNLLPLAYEKPAPNTRTKGLKTGKNREFLQKMAFGGNFYTTQTRTRPQISKHLHHTRFKIPCKNNREFFGLYQGIISEYQGTTT